MGMPVIISSNIERCDAITDIIQSVALEQAALSHILNAEGEKLQLIIKTEKDPAVILETNNSVRSMVESIAKLEMILQSKLGLFETCLCKDCVKEGEVVTEPVVEEPVKETEEQAKEVISG